MNWFSGIDAVVDAALIKTMEGVAWVLGDRPEEEPIYAIGATVEAVLTQLSPETVWEEGESFSYDPSTQEITVPDLLAGDLESRVKAAHEAMHARRHARGETAYETLPNDKPLDHWSVRELWGLFTEEFRTNRELKRWLWKRIGPSRATMHTTEMTWKYFLYWSRRFFTFHWRGKAAPVPKMAQAMGATPTAQKRWDYLEVEGAPAPTASEESGADGWKEMFRWLGSGVVVCTFLIPFVTFLRLMITAMFALKPVIALMGLCGAAGSLGMAFFLASALHK